MADHVEFEFRGGGGHKDGASDVEFAAAVGDALGVVAGAGGHYAAFALLGVKVAEGSGCPSEFEASDGLQVLTF